MQKPEKRENRSDWWTRWEEVPYIGVHYIGHTTWMRLENGNVIYRDEGGDGVGDTSRSLFAIECLQTTGVMLIQRDKGGTGKDRFAFASWHSAWRIKNLKVRPRPGVWFECELELITRFR